MASPKVRWGEAKKLEDMRKSTKRTWQDFTEMRTGFVKSPYSISYCHLPGVLSVNESSERATKNSIKLSFQRT